MKNTLIILSLFVVLFTACDTEQDVIDTGVSDPIFNGSMMDYLKSNEFNWGITVEMIEKAQLVEVFEGTKDTIHYKGEIIDGLDEFTFLGFTSMSCRHYIYPLLDESVEELNEDTLLNVVSEIECRELILKHIIKGKILKADVAYRDIEIGPITADGQTGYSEYTAIDGNNLWLYNDRNDYAGVPGAGATLLRVFSIDAKVHLPVATPDIQPNNGVVHALDYDYKLNNL